MKPNFVREGSIPQEETPEKVAELFTLLASQPVSSNQHGPVIFNEADSQCLVSRVQGIRVAVFHPCSDALVLAAEAVIGSVEAFFCNRNRKRRRSAYRELHYITSR